MFLYHGTDKYFTNPTYGIGNINNDFGLGFYLTENIELAKEWACKSTKNSVINKYELDMQELNILNLMDDKYTILNWITILVENRMPTGVSPIMLDGLEFLKSNYHINIDSYDIIRGYRADDSYFSFARAFLRNEITIGQLSIAMNLGKLGEQIVLKSKKSFDKLKYIETIDVDYDKYYEKRIQRDTTAKKEYEEMLLAKATDDKYIRDIIKEKR